MFRIFTFSIKTILFSGTARQVYLYSVIQKEGDSRCFTRAQKYIKIKPLKNIKLAFEIIKIKAKSEPPD